MSKTQGFLTVEGFTSTLTKYEKSMIHLLNVKYGISYDEFVETCITAVKKMPKLLHCDRSSLIGCVLLCASVGLKPNTPDQHCFIIPRGDEATFQMGYQGLVEIMYRNPKVKKIAAEVVYDKDDFEYSYGLNPSLNHKPFRGKDRGVVSAAYCIVQLSDADPLFTVVEQHVLKEIESLSPAIDTKFSPYTNGKDVHNFMQIKASIKKISKLVPKQDTRALGLAVDFDSKFEGGSKVRIDLNSKDGEIVSPEFIDGETQNKSIQSAFNDEGGEDVLKKVRDNVEGLEKEKVQPKSNSNNPEKQDEKQEPYSNQKMNSTPDKSNSKKDSSENTDKSFGEVNFEDVSEDLSQNSKSERKEEKAPSKKDNSLSDKPKTFTKTKKSSKKEESKIGQTTTDESKKEDKLESTSKKETNKNIVKDDVPKKEKAVEEDRLEPNDDQDELNDDQDEENLFDFNDDMFDEDEAF